MNSVQECIENVYLLVSSTRRAQRLSFMMISEFLAYMVSWIYSELQMYKILTTGVHFYVSGRIIMSRPTIARGWFWNYEVSGSVPGRSGADPAPCDSAHHCSTALYCVSLSRPQAQFSRQTFASTMFDFWGVRVSHVTPAKEGATRIL